MNISDKGIGFIQRREALRLQAYLDEADIPSIGFGSTMYLNGAKVKMGDTITEEEALNLLMHDIAHRVMCLNGWISGTLAQYQFDAICSFVYNVGLEAFKASTMLKKINAGFDKQSVAAEFDKWVYITLCGKKVVSAGLATRRGLEKDLFLNGVYK
jgi:lysozyme